MQFEVRHDGQITLVRCSGRIVKGNGADSLLRAVMSQDSSDIHIDLSGVKDMDAAGLGALAELERWARAGKRSIQLMNPSPRVRDGIEATGLSAVLQVRTTARGRAA